MQENSRKNIMNINMISIQEFKNQDILGKQFYWYIKKKIFEKLLDRL